MSHPTKLLIFWDGGSTTLSLTQVFFLLRDDSVILTQTRLSAITFLRGRLSSLLVDLTHHFAIHSQIPPVLAILLLLLHFAAMDIATAAGVVGGLVQVVFDKYYGCKLEQWATRAGLQEAYVNLKGELDMARAVLEVLGRRGTLHSKSLGVLIVDLKDTAYDAEDALDDMDYFRLKELVEGPGSAKKLSAGSSPSSSTSALRFALCQSGEIVASALKNAKQVATAKRVARHKANHPPSFNRDAMANRVASITDRLKNACSRVERVINVQSMAAIKDHTRPDEVNWRKTSSLMTETKILGRDAARDHVIQLLLAPHGESRYTNFSVLPIVGIGGVGKTTLTQLVYNNEQVLQAFDFQAWACVSENLNVERVTWDILASVQKNVPSSQNLDALHKSLKEELKAKKFLIVLDDVWVTSGWDELCAPFTCGRAGSRVIVTTRNHNIARKLGSIPQFTLDGLESEDFWRFFKQNAFGGINPSDDDKLVSIGRRIARKLHGIPLAAKTIGRLLNKNMNEEHWFNILESNLLEVENKERPEGIMPALLLSYHHLSSNAQRCFAFCSVFPRDYQFSDQELIHVWVALGFTLETREGKSPEQSARQCLDELLSVSFFQSSDSNHFTMHGLLRELADFVSEGECGEINLSEISHFPARKRHLLVSGHMLDLFMSASQTGRRPSPFSHLEKSSLRSLIFTISSCTSFILYTPGAIFSNIRMLCLPSTSMMEQLDAIGSLIHLRYLDLQRSDVATLPDSICKLYQLQVLNIVGCSKLVQLPECFSDLISLRHLIEDQGRNFMSKVSYIGKQSCLQKLDQFDVQRNDGFGIEQLSDLNDLRGSLRVCCLENVNDKEEAIKARLSSKKYITKLLLSWSEDLAAQSQSVGEEVLGALRPHQNLRCLHVSGYSGDNLPKWLANHMHLNSLESLYLEDCVELKRLPSLAHLPHLRKLHMINIGALRQIGSEFYGSGQLMGFPSLEELLIGKMPQLQDWNEVEHFGIFPNLTTLTIRNCPELYKVPSFLGPMGNNQWFLRLTAILIYRCPKLISLNPLPVPQLPQLVHTKFVGQNFAISLGHDHLLIKERGGGNESSLNVEIFLELESLSHISYFSIQSRHLLIRPWKQEGQPSEMDLDNGTKSQKTFTGNLVISGSGITDELLSAILVNHTCPSTLSIRGCQQISSLDLSPLGSLESLVLNNCTSLNLLSGLQAFSNLRMLEVSEVPHFHEAWNFLWESVKTEQEKITISMECLIIDSMSLLTFKFCWMLSHLKNLVIKEDFTPSSFSPEQEQALLQLVSLQELGFIDCGLYVLPNILHKMPTLKHLEITACRLIESFPKNGLPISIEKLTVMGCKLYEKCNEHGSEWYKISHIRSIILEKRWIVDRGMASRSISYIVDSFKSITITNTLIIVEFHEHNYCRSFAIRAQ